LLAIAKALRTLSRMPINRIVDAGNTMIIMEHNLDVIRNADWVVDMGPEGGTKGGRVLFQGTPRDLLAAGNSLTARHLS
jgi:excinuclease UvrABC ATPase subunit